MPSGLGVLHLELESKGCRTLCNLSAEGGWPWENFIRKLVNKKWDIPASLQNPKVLVRYDAEVVCDFVTKAVPVFGDGFAQEA